MASTATNQHQKQQQQQQQRTLQEAAAGFTSTVLWCLCSSLLIVYNKYLYANGFPYPLMVTGMGQAFSALAGFLLAGAGVMPLRPPPNKFSDYFKLTPIIACTAATMFWGNAAYMHLSVSFIQILKAFTPALTLVIGVVVGVERLRPGLVVSVLLIALGTGGAVLVESGTPSYSTYGLLLFIGSSATEAGRVVCSQLLLGAYRYNSAEVLVYVGTPAALLLIAGSFVMDAPSGMLMAARTMWATQKVAMLKAWCMSGLVNLTSYMAIATTSSLTFKVAGCMKNLLVVWYGVVTHGDHITVGHLVGYAVSLAGFALYSKLKSTPSGVHRVVPSKSD